MGRTAKARHRRQRRHREWFRVLERWFGIDNGGSEAWPFQGDEMQMTLPGGSTWVCSRPSTKPWVLEKKEKRS